VRSLNDLTHLSSFLWAAVALAGLYLVLQWSRLLGRIWRHPERHPAIIRAAAGTDPAQVIDTLNTEPDSPVFKKRGVRVTENWILFPMWIRFAPIHVTDLFWAHATVTTTRLYGFIPISRGNSVVVYDRFGNTQTREASEVAVQEILKAIHSAAPWAFFGFHDERRNAFLNPKSRLRLVREVDERRAKLHRSRL
jgi:hypothetical protein